MRVTEAVLEKEQDDHFRLMFERSPVGMALVDLDGSWIDANPAVCELTGYTREELLARDFQSITHPDDLGADLDAVQRLIAGESDGYQMDKRYIRPDGSAVWALLSVSLVRASDGQPQYFVVEIIDTDRLRRVESALAARDRLFRLTFEASPVGMAVTREDGTIAEVNQALVDLFGSTTEQMVGHHHAEFTHPDDHVIGDDRTATPGAEELRQFEKRYVRADGSVFWAQVSVSPAIQIDGSEVHLVHVDDISSRRHAELQRDREQAVLRRLVDIQRDIAAQPDAQTMLDAVVAQTLQLVEHADGAVVELPAIDEDGCEVLRYAAAVGMASDQLGLTVKVSASLSGLSFTEGELMHSVETDDDPRVDAAACRKAGIRSTLIAPLIAGNETLGVLKVSSSKPHAFDVADEQALTLIALSLSGALRQTWDRDALSERAQLLDLANDAVIARGMDGRVRYWGPGAERTYGWPAPAALGRQVDRLLGTEFLDTPNSQDPREQLLAKGHWEGELVHHSAKGNRLIIHSRKAVQRDKAGNPIGILAINTDITARRNAEEALTASEELFRSQFEYSAVGQCIRGLDETIESANPALVHMLGYDTADELVGMSVRDLSDPEGLARRDDALAAIFAGERDSIAYEGSMQRKDGSLLEVHFTTSALRGPTGRPIKFVSIFQDISARKQAEIARDEAVATLQSRHDELEKMEGLKTDLIAMLGHEINTPLTVLIGVAEMAQDKIEDDEAIDLPEFIAVLHRNTESLRRTVADVLNLVTAENGQLMAKPVPLNVAAHLEGIVGTYDVPAEIACPTQVSVLVQPGHFDQIIGNLLSNAKKYGEPPLTINVVEAGDWVEISVADHGRGVPPQFRDELFRRFARDADAASRASGTGIGLYIVRELANANLGDVAFSETPGGGATFTLSLPRATV
ncbi:MAG: PAS domain S-box protein [Marmoricola sp.]